MKKSLRNLMIGAVMTAGIFAASASALAATQFVQEDMNFRNGASITSTVIGSVPGGAEVEVLGQVNGWDLIRYNGRVGYIHGGNMADTYVVKQDTSKTSAPAASQNNTLQPRARAIPIPEHRTQPRIIMTPPGARQPGTWIHTKTAHGRRSM